MAGSISVAVLAGGRSSRMGVNKALVEVGGKPIIKRVLERVTNLGDEVFIVANDRDAYAYLGLPVYTDLIHGKGPLGGLYTALAKSQGEHTLAVSCDQPFLNPGLLGYLLGLRDGYDVVVPLNREGYPQSMHAVYGRGCIEPVRQDVEANRLKVIGFYPQVRVREVAGEAIDRYDPNRYSFFNVNTPQDLAEAQRLATMLD